MGNVVGLYLYQPHLLSRPCTPELYDVVWHMLHHPRIRSRESVSRELLMYTHVNTTTERHHRPWQSGNVVRDAN